MTARFIVADVFDGLAGIEDGTVDLVVTSPPFLALRSYLPADHSDKAKEIGQEATPAEFIDTLLRVTAELRRVLAPYGSICVELGDTYAGSGGAGGDWIEGSGQRVYTRGSEIPDFSAMPERKGDGWPLAKSKTLIPELYRVALAYGINPLTGQPSPAGRWRVRNVVTWCRPNPPVGALGDKWRPATSDVVIACLSDKRYWDDIATRKPHSDPDRTQVVAGARVASERFGEREVAGRVMAQNSAGAPLLDWWEIPPGGYPGSHYAVYPPALVEPLIKAMAPPKVCRTCGEPSRRTHRPGLGIPEVIKEARERAGLTQKQVAEWFPSKTGGVTGCVWNWENGKNVPTAQQWELLKERLGIGDEYDHLIPDRETVSYEHVSDHPSGITQDATGRIYQRLPARKNRIDSAGWSDCGHDDWRPAVVLDPFVGSGTTLAVATGHGHDAIGIDLDERNYDLALERVGPLVLGPPEKPQPKAGVGS